MTTIDPEVRHISGDHFGFWENLGQTDDSSVGEIHPLAIFSNQTRERNALGFGDRE